MDTRLVVKANKLNESRYRLTVQEQRIVLTMLSMIEPGDLDFKPYRFTVKDFAELIGVKRKDIYGSVKAVTRDLLGRRMTIKETDGDLQGGWISSAKYFDGEGAVELRFDPLLKPYLLALKKEFTRYQLKNTIRLKSAYSVRIYELLKQYQGVGRRVFQIDELRACLGVPENKLPLFGNLKARVLERARKELVSTDIGFNYNTIKTGRKITALEFVIFKNDDVVKGSYKNSKEMPVETQLVLPLEDHKNRQKSSQLDKLEGKYPELFQTLKKQAEKRLTKAEKKKPGLKTTIRFKMQSLLPGFIQKKKIEGL